MILGDPYHFAIMAESVSAWNIDKSFCNGILVFLLNNHLFPPEICNATLRYELPLLKEKLLNPVIDPTLYAQSDIAAFSQMYDSVFTKEDSNDLFDWSPSVFSDHNYYVFAVGNGIQIRILAAHLNYIPSDGRHDLRQCLIQEAILSSKEAKEIAASLDAVLL